MPKPFVEWTVLPHGKLERLDDNLLTVQGTLSMPFGEVKRRMTVVRLASGKLVIYSAMALDEAEMSVLEAFGTPAHLVVPNALHRLDVKAWKSRYPTIEVITPPAARTKVERLVPVDRTDADFGDPSVRYVVIRGTGDRDSALEVHGPGGTTLVLNDLVFNQHKQPGFGGWLMEKLGATGDRPHIPGFVKLREVVDADALRAELERWARLPNLRRILVSHGSIIANDPPGVLRQIARELDGRKGDKRYGQDSRDRAVPVVRR